MSPFSYSNVKIWALYSLLVSLQTHPKVHQWSILTRPNKCQYPITFILSCLSDVGRIRGRGGGGDVRGGWKAIYGVVSRGLAPRHCRVATTLTGIRAANRDERHGPDPFTCAVSRFVCSPHHSYTRATCFCWHDHLRR
jgi:hypothetical protein